MANLDEMDPTGLQGDRLRSVTGMLAAMARFERLLRDAITGRHAAFYSIRSQTIGGKVNKAIVQIDEQFETPDLAMRQFERRVADAEKAQGNGTYLLKYQVRDGKITGSTVQGDEQFPCADLTHAEED